MNKHTKITVIEREQILKLTSQGKSLRQIALQLGRDHSNISREVRRAGMNYKTYSLASAQVDRNQKAALKGRRSKLVKGSRLLAFVREKILQARWSPEQVSGYFAMDQRQTQISYESIYRYIYALKDLNEKELWIKALRRKRKRRQARKKGGEERSNILDRVSIHSRPECINERKEGGHWEGDLIIGQHHASAIGTAVERVSRLTIIVPLQGQKTSDAVVSGFAKTFSKIPSILKKSMTYDNGSEMARHKVFTEQTGMTVYFADPGCPGQRGTNENTNGLIREFFPKGTDFNKVSQEELKYVERLLNHRPRKVLGFQTPLEVSQKMTKGNSPRTKGQLRSTKGATMTLP